MMVQKKNTEISEKEIEEILRGASGQQKKQMDEEGIFASEELIAATMQKLKQVGENHAMQQAEQDKPFRQGASHKKQIGRIALLAAAVFVIVLAARGGIWMFHSAGNSKEFHMDGEGMLPSAKDDLKSSEQSGFSQDGFSQEKAIPTEPADDVNNGSAPDSAAEPSYLPEYADRVSVYGWNGRKEAVATTFSIETVTSLFDASGEEEDMAVLSEAEEYLLQKEEEPSGFLTGGMGIKPQLLYGTAACSALKIIRANKEALQIVFDYPQDFLYVCGREGECFYLLVTRRMPSGSYGHQLLSFDFEAKSAEALALPEETDGLLAWISLQDGKVAYECEK